MNIEEKSSVISLQETRSAESVLEILRPLEGKIFIGGSLSPRRYARGQDVDYLPIIGFKLEQVIVAGKFVAFYLSHESQSRTLFFSTQKMCRWSVHKDPDLEIVNSAQGIFVFGDTTLLFFDPLNFSTLRIIPFSETKRRIQEVGPDILTPPDKWHEAIPIFISRVRRFAQGKTVLQGLQDERICTGYRLHAAGKYHGQHLAEMTDTELKLVWSFIHYLHQSP